MDRKSVIVLVICGALFLLWSQLTPRLYPKRPNSRTNNISRVTNPLPAGSNQAAATPIEAPRTPFVPTTPGAPEELLVVSNEVARFTFTSHGGGLKLAELLKYPESVACGINKRTPAVHRLATLNAQGRQPALALTGSEALAGDRVYQLSRFSRSQPVPGKTNETRVVQGVRAEKVLGNGLQVVKEFEIASDYLIQVRAQLKNTGGQPLPLPAEQWIVGSATPLNLQDNGQFVGLQWYDGRSDTHIDKAYFDNLTLGCFPGTPRSEYKVAGTPVGWAAAQNQFFFLGLIPRVAAPEISAVQYPLPIPSKEELADVHGAITNQFAVEVAVNYGATNLAPGAVLDREFSLFAGPKEYRTLERIGADQKNQIDRVMGYGGFFGFFSRLLLLSMNGLNSLGLSYGLAIIAITVIIKLLFWPLTQASTRSMKRMAALQPQMKAIQEKYKDDPAKMNRKVMEFMKENKVSPLGGCLPLLLQIPVFIGFFKMVQTAIELRGATFLWACDLSQPDTIFVIPGLDFNVNPLPLLMGGTMLWQAHLTPPSPGMDPMQQKIMKYFPLIFLFMLYNYSAGLTLYWTVQNLLSIAQMKLTKTTEPTAKPAAPEPARPSAPKKKK